MHFVFAAEEVADVCGIVFCLSEEMTSSEAEEALALLDEAKLQSSAAMRVDKSTVRSSS